MNDAYSNHIELMRDTLQTWANNKPIGYKQNRTPVNVKDLSDEEVIAVFEQYIYQIKAGSFAGLPEEWKNIFLKVYEEATDSVLLKE